jgi:hypothetical protein
VEEKEEEREIEKNEREPVEIFSADDEATQEKREKSNKKFNPESTSTVTATSRRHGETSIFTSLTSDKN